MVSLGQQVTSGHKGPHVESQLSKPRGRVCVLAFCCMFDVQRILMSRGP